MKSDNYLDLCLEQATNSPLRYCHGAIIVRGGKVIGRGFNDYRPGFNGGALKTGCLPRRPLSGPALDEFKERHTHKRAMASSQNGIPDTFMPFETMNSGRKLVTTPLSMHAEMMAIHSALSTTSTTAPTAALNQKPGLKVPSGSERKPVRAYVETVSKSPLPQFKDDVSKTVNVKSRSVSPSSQLGEGTSKVNVDGLKSNKHSTRRRSHQRRQYPHQLSQGWITASENNHLVYNKTDSSRCYVYSEMKSKGPSRAASNSAKKMKTPPKPRTQPKVMSIESSEQSNRRLADRFKYPRLHGADLYVARLGWKTARPPDGSESCKIKPKSKTEKENNDILPRPSTGSLHEEILNSRAEASAAASAPWSAGEKLPCAVTSRPCYRCISYMAAVGIKRVFWTTESGNWEGAKVRDLVDALDGSGLEHASGTTAALDSVFVTRHEILMLRRVMGM